MFSWPCWTLALVVVVAGTATPFIGQRIFTRRTGTNITVEFPVPNAVASWRLKRPGSDKYVAYCQDGMPTWTTDQEESFQGRVEVMDCDKINGLVPVTLSNLTESDSGWYDFHSVGSDDRRSNEVIFLNVTDSGPAGGTTEDGWMEDGWKEDGGKEDGGMEGGSVGLIVGLIVTLIVLVLFVFAGMKFLLRSSQLPPI